MASHQSISEPTVMRSLKPITTVVVIPTYNERETVSSLAQATLQRQSELKDFDLRILIVDSNSHDGTQELVQALMEHDPRVQLLEIPERGLGLALMQGYHWAHQHMGAKIIVQMDADLSHNPDYLPEMLLHIAQGYDLVVGSRYIQGGGIRDWPLRRRILSRAGNWVIRLLTGVWGFHDWTSGYRAFTIELYKRLDHKSIGWRDFTLQSAFVYDAVCKGATVKEVPIIFVNRHLGVSKMPVLRYSFNLVRYFVVARLRHLIRGRGRG